MTQQSLGRLVLDEIAQTFHEQKAMVEKAIVQVSDEKLHVSLHPETNSVAIVMKHVAGNLLSRWTDFLTTRR